MAKATKRIRNTVQVLVAGAVLAGGAFFASPLMAGAAGGPCDYDHVVDGRVNLQDVLHAVNHMEVADDDGRTFSLLEVLGTANALGAKCS